MLKAQVYKGSKIIEKIRDFYLLLYQQRLYSNAKYKYPRSVAERNIRNTLSFIGKEFNDSELRRSINSQWARNGWYEIKYNNWHFAVVVQLDLFGNNIAIIQDCIHNKDYHNDTMQTEPFKMDSPNDQSHLVDWKLIRLTESDLHRIVRESVNKILKEDGYSYNGIEYQKNLRDRIKKGDSVSDVDTSIGRIEERFPSDFIPDIHIMMSEKQVDNEMKFKKHAVSYHILDNQYITVKVTDYRGRSKESFKWRTPYSEDDNRGWWDIFYNLYIGLICKK